MKLTADMRAQLAEYAAGRGMLADYGRAAIGAALEDLDEARAVLLSLEWDNYGDDAARLCPSCCQYRSFGHAGDCRLSAAIEGGV